MHLIGLARVLLAKKGIIIIDEPTSIDQPTE
jgi:ABC-type transport system involved in cytochrome bd biosynthesis fused ATPase/permease subunit